MFPWKVGVEEEEDGALVLVLGGAGFAVLVLLVLTVAVVLTIVLLWSTATVPSEEDCRSWWISTRTTSSLVWLSGLHVGAPQVEKKSSIP